MFEIVLVEPEIPPNTGNVMRLAANVGATLHLVRPLGFRLTDRHLRRAGLDYREMAALRVHDDWHECERALTGRRMHALSTRGRRHYGEARFEPGDVFVFGAETRGLPETVLAGFAPEHVLRVPMVPGNRSLNLANTVAVVVFEAWRQAGFAGGA